MKHGRFARGIVLTLDLSLFRYTELETKTVVFDYKSPNPKTVEEVPVQTRTPSPSTVSVTMYDPTLFSSCLSTPMFPGMDYR